MTLPYLLGIGNLYGNFDHFYDDGNALKHLESQNSTKPVYCPYPADGLYKPVLLASKLEDLKLNLKDYPSESSNLDANNTGLYSPSAG